MPRTLYVSNRYFEYGQSYRDFGAVDPRHSQPIADTGSLRNSKAYTYAV